MAQPSGSSSVAVEGQFLAADVAGVRAIVPADKGVVSMLGEGCLPRVFGVVHA